MMQVEASPSTSQDSELSSFAIFAKVVVKPGQRDAVLQVLLQASRLPMPGCDLYIVNVSASESDAIYVYEAWHSEADHDASLKMESVKALVLQARPMVERFENTKLKPVGGRGLDT